MTNVFLQEIPDWLLRHNQSCPFCGQEHIMLIKGLVNDNDKGCQTNVADKGYSFCNCKNVFFTDWSNIDKKIYDQGYVNRYNIKDHTDYFRKYFMQYFNYFKELNCMAKKLLDVGMASDIVLDYATEFGYEAYGNDINKCVKSKYPIYYGSIEDVITEIPKMDIIWASHVIEHFKDPLITCKKFYDNLNTSGLMFVAMPDPWFIDWANVYNWKHWALREHHILWDMDSFIDEMEAIGFKLKFQKRNALPGYIYYGDFNLVFQKP